MSVSHREGTSSMLTALRAKNASDSIRGEKQQWRSLNDVAFISELPSEERLAGLKTTEIRKEVLR
jgi:hypothetical protein